MLGLAWKPRVRLKIAINQCCQNSKTNTFGALKCIKTHMTVFINGFYLQLPHISVCQLFLLPVFEWNLQLIPMF